MKKKIPELLSPAGNYEKMVAAIRYGTDAVYLASKQFGMRAAADNFTKKELDKAINYAHERGKRVYITANVMPHEGEYSALKKYFRSLSSLPPDALIIGDIGVIETAKEILPNTEIHLSTQASAVSAASCRAWQKLGVSRVVLARELNLEEIKKIKKNIPKDLELEAFIHGSMCVSYSGRCLLSNCFTGRDSNRGACAQPCRWDFVISEVKRPNEQFPVFEDKNGTFIMSSKDMCMIEHIPELCECGIDSLKIEGRMKSAYYTAVTANAYRMALDAYKNDPKGYKYDPAWLCELESVSHREYATGYYFDRPMINAQTTENGGYIREKAYLATANGKKDKKGYSFFIQKNKTKAGDYAELVSPGKTGRLFKIEDMVDEKGCSIEAAPHPFQKFGVKVPFEVKEGDILRGSDKKD